LRSIASPRKYIPLARLSLNNSSGPRSPIHFGASKVRRIPPANNAETPTLLN
jgi:hypothetical protein